MTDHQFPEQPEGDYQSPAPDQPPTPPVKPAVPFEDNSLDFFSGLIQTVKLVLFEPVHFFRDYRIGGGGSISRPMIFAVITGWIGIIFDTIWTRILSKVVFKWIRERLEESSLFDLDWDKFNFDQFGSSLGKGTEEVISLILGPVVLIVGLFIISGLFHLFLMMVKGNTQTFETTFSVACYCMTTHLAMVIPLCGSLISWVYGIILSIIGIKEAHPTSTGKSLFAVLGPYALCCLCCLAAFFMISMAGGLAGLAN